MRSIVVAACAALLLGASSAAIAAAAPQPGAAPAVAPILTAPEARDVMTFARPEIARVTHVDLDLEVDFEAQTLRGAATLSVLARPGAKEIVLDSDNLAVTRVTDEKGRALAWSIGAAEDGKGAPLTVQLNGAQRIVIHYTASKGASALQWLPPQLTAGKQKPMLFS